MQRTTRLAGLDCRVLQQTDGPPTAAVVLAHGYGAPGDDLVGLTEMLWQLAPALSTVRFVYPAAPLSLEAMYGGGARAWWNIDMLQVQRLAAADPNALREFRKLEPEGMPAARAAMLKLVDELSVQTGLGLGQLVLGGFSQGAMLTTDVALRLPEAPRALVTLSGTLLLEDAWRAKARARAGLRVFQSHGRRDPILRFDAAELLRDLLVEGGLTVDFHPFDGGHEIPLGVLRSLAAFLTAATKST